MAYTRYGKLIADDIPIFTTKGWKTHGELNVGDFVFHPSGKQIKVIGVGSKDFASLEVVFSNGEKIKVHPDHEWFVALRHHSGKFKIWETKEIKKRKLLSKKGFGYFRIPRTLPLIFDKKDLLLDPYFLGAWLGDGISAKPAIVGQTKDYEIIKNIPYKVSAQQIHKTTGVILYNFYRSRVFNSLRKLNLIKNKHIPEIYKFSSIEQRLQLLAGLIDTDGSYPAFEKNKTSKWPDRRMVFVNTNKKLIADVKELIISLGMNPRLIEVDPPQKANSAGIIGKKRVYVISFLPLLEIPTQLERKKVNIPKNIRLKTIREINEIKPEPGNCIQVDSGDGMYLVGRSLIPTHNSFTVALAILTHAATFPAKWAIVAGTEKQAKIIMSYIIEHIFDNEYTKSKLEISKDESAERVRRERSKSRLNFKHTDGTFGEVFVLSADSRNKQRAGDALMGFGAPNIVQDEAALVDDDIEAKIFRMLGDKPDNFLFKIGNPFRLNHFHKDWKNPGFFKLNIPWQQGVAEGRSTREFIEESRAKPLFDILYENEFPTADMIDDKGYVPLVSERDLRIAKDSGFIGRTKLGVDPAGEGDDLALVVGRDRFKAKVIAREQRSTQRSTAARTLTAMKELKVKGYDVCVDNFGEGANVAQELAMAKHHVNAVNVGRPADDEERFYNKRAEAYWRAREWLISGGELIGDGWNELLDIKYRVETNGKIKIMGKDEMRRNGIASPNQADALMLTFVDADMSEISEWRAEEEKFDKHAVV